MNCESYDPRQIANIFINLDFKDNKIYNLSNMQLQKLVYISHGFTLATLESPLVNIEPVAYQWGPVFEELYNALQNYKNRKVNKEIDNYELSLEDLKEKDYEIYEIIEKVFTSYKHLTAYELSALTHRPNTPWTKTWSTQKFSTIENDLIENYYKNLVKNKQITGF